MEAVEGHTTAYFSSLTNNCERTLTKPGDVTTLRHLFALVEVKKRYRDFSTVIVA
jgi:hypothetical protein